MRKCRLYIIVMLLLCVLGMNGCKKGHKDDAVSATLSPFASQSEIDAYNKKMASKIKVKKANGKYKYNQKENLINDKYRNF